MGVKIIKSPKKYKFDTLKVNIALREAAMDYRSETIERTKKGLDIHNKSFKPYSKRYAKAKALGKLPRSSGKKTDIVDLELSGDMLNSIHIKIIPGKVQIYPTRHSEVGYIHQIGIGVPKREWWGLTNSMQKDILAKISKATRMTT